MEQPTEKTPHTIRIYSDPNEDLEDDLRPEYDFDYSKARPNPYAERARKQRAEAREAEAKEAENIQSKEG